MPPLARPSGLRKELQLVPEEIHRPEDPVPGEILPHVCTFGPISGGRIRDSEQLPPSSRPASTTAAAGCQGYGQESALGTPMQPPPKEFVEAAPCDPVGVDLDDEL